MYIFILDRHLDLVTVEDWGEEIFPDGGGVKLKKLARGEGEGKEKTYYLAFCSKITPGLKARLTK